MEGIIKKLEDIKTVVSSKLVQLPDHKYLSDLSKQMDEFVIACCLQISRLEKAAHERSGNLVEQARDFPINPEHGPRMVENFDILVCIGIFRAEKAR